MNREGEKRFHDTVESSVKALRAAKAGRRAFWKYVSRMMGLGWLFVIPVVGGAYLGRYLDRKLASENFWTLSLIILGVVLGLYNVWHFIYEKEK